MTLSDGNLRLRNPSRDPAKLVAMSSLRLAGIGDYLTALGMKVFPESGDFVVAMEGLHRLFETNGDEQADHNGCNVNEKTFPGMHGLVRSVDIEHGW